MKYQIESRYPTWAKWRKVTARPHDERMPFNKNRELEFLTETEAVDTMAQIAKANAGEYRIITTPDPDKNIDEIERLRDALKMCYDENDRLRLYLGAGRTDFDH